MPLDTGGKPKHLHVTSQFSIGYIERERAQRSVSVGCRCQPDLVIDDNWRRPPRSRKFHLPANVFRLIPSERQICFARMSIIARPTKIRPVFSRGSNGKSEEHKLATRHLIIL